MKFLVRITFFALLCSTFMWAQETSQIAGTVHDPTGAAIPGASVKAIQTDTGFSRTTTTSSEGAYVLPSLPVGPYRLEVTKDGFNKFLEPGIVLQVNTNPDISPVLKVGSISDQVTVEAEALTVETHSTGVGQVIDHEQIVDLPLNSRET